MKRSIVNHIDVGELVFEPFGGSGTTLAAAEATQRVCLCTELEPKYVDVICRRWMSFTGKEVILDGDGRTFDQISAARQGV